MFWNVLSNDDADKLYFLMNEVKPWMAWAALSKTKKAITPEPKRPTDQQFSDLELLSMKGWNMFRRCPWRGEICECDNKRLGFPWKENGKIPQQCSRIPLVS